MTIQSTRWPDDQWFQCPVDNAIKVQLSKDEVQFSQSVDGSGNVTGLSCTYNLCPCGQSHTQSISRTDLIALNIPPFFQQPSIVAATIAGNVYQ
jgi:hypothetical protein